MLGITCIQRGSMYLSGPFIPIKLDFCRANCDDYFKTKIYINETDPLTHQSGSPTNKHGFFSVFFVGDFFLKLLDFYPKSFGFQLKETDPLTHQ